MPSPFLLIYHPCHCSSNPQSITSIHCMWARALRAPRLGAQIGKHQMALCRLSWNQSWVSPAELWMRRDVQSHNTDSRRNLNTDSNLVCPTDQTKPWISYSSPGDLFAFVLGILLCLLLSCQRPHIKLIWEILHDKPPQYVYLLLKDLGIIFTCPARHRHRSSCQRSPFPAENPAVRPKSTGK